MWSRYFLCGPIVTGLMDDLKRQASGIRHQAAGCQAVGLRPLPIVDSMVGGYDLRQVPAGAERRSMARTIMLNSRP